MNKQTRAKKKSPVKREIKEKKMSYSSVLIHAPALTLKPNTSGHNRTRRSNVVCCCPLSVKDTKSNKPPFSLISFGPFSLVFNGWEKVDRRLPPGPSMLHLIGLMHYALRSVPYHHPLRDLANTYGPLVHIKLGEVSTILVSSPDIAKEVLKTRDPEFANRPKSVATQIISYDYTDIILSPYNDYWRQMRNVAVSKFLSPKNVQAFEYIRKEEASAVVESILSNNCGGVPFNLTDKILLFMNSTACRVIFGDMCIDVGEVVVALKRGLSLGAGFGLADMFPSIQVFDFISLNKYRMLAVKKKVDKTLDTIIDDRRKNLAKLDNEAFIDVLLRLKDSEEDNISITDDNIKSVIADLVGAAIETSSSLVEWAMAELMKNSRVMAKAQEEIRQAFDDTDTIQESEIGSLKYLNLVIKETLRLHPPTAITTRACREETEIEGYHIPRGANIIVNNWALGRDPKYWEKPEKFEPERFESNGRDFTGGHFEYIPFGAGKRMCPGIALGLANAEALLAKLLYHFDWSLHPHGLDMTESDGIAVSRRDALYLMATPYHPAPSSHNHVPSTKD